MKFETKINNEGFKLTINNGEVESLECSEVLFDEDNLDKLKSLIKVYEGKNSIKVKIKDTLISEYDKNLDKLKEYPLTNFSLKNILFSNNSQNVELKQLDYRYQPQTDLHTHFGGILSAKELIDVCHGKNIKIPEFILDKITTDKNIKTVEDLSLEETSKLEKLLSIPIDKQSTFVDMEEIYKCRAFIVKNKDLFPDMMQKISKKYKEEGIKYAEISFAGVTSPEYIEQINELVPQLYKEDGVLIGFMAALWRHSDEPWNVYELEKLKKAIHNPYIVGLDVMGQETNSILDMKHILTDFANYVKEVDPEFNFRIHAGENLTRPENIKESLNIARETGIKMRIGHGLYGVDSDVIDLARETGAAIEFNLNSNLSLSNIEGYANYVRRYSSQGVNCVFGSDGGGIYQGSAYDSMSVIDLSNDEIEQLNHYESDYIRSKKIQIKSKLNQENCHSLPKPTSLTKALLESKKIERKHKERIENIKSDLIERNIQLFSQSELQNYTEDKNITLFSGASRSSWPLISIENQIEIDNFIKEMINGMDIEKDVIITGGTNYGVEKIVHEYAHKKGIKVIGTLTEDAMVQEIEDNTISSAIMFEGSWYDKHSRLIELLSGLENKTAIFIGGGDIVSTEIQSFKNWNQENDTNHINMKLMELNNCEGASSVKAKSDPQYGFRNIKDFEEINETNQIQRKIA